MVCTKCKQDKPLESFHKSANTPTGRHSICAPCRVSYVTNDRKSFPGQVRAYQRKRNAAVRVKIIQLLGGKCKRCGFADFRALQVDHVNGGGSKELKGKSSTFYHKLLKFLVSNPSQSVYQCLCANCNWIKRSENNEKVKIKVEG